jgi:WD40 repeat protein
MIPISLGNLSNITASGDENGNIYVWRSVDAVKDNIGVNLTGHTAHIQRIEFTVDDKRLLSLGMTDQTLCQWKIDSIMEDDEVLTGKGISEERMKKRTARINMDDDSLINELNFCYSD